MSKYIVKKGDLYIRGDGSFSDRQRDAFVWSGKDAAAGWSPPGYRVVKLVPKKRFAVKCGHPGVMQLYMGSDGFFNLSEPDLLTKAEAEARMEKYHQSCAELVKVA